MPRSRDVGWEHGKMIDNNRYKVQCTHCGKQILGGGITRLKQHLAGGFANVKDCPECPEEVRAFFHTRIKDKTVKRRRTNNELNMMTMAMPNEDNDASDEEDGHEHELQRALRLSRADMHEKELERRLNHNSGAGTSTLPCELNLELESQRKELGSYRRHTTRKELTSENEKLRRKLQEMEEKALLDAETISYLQEKLKEKDDHMEYMEALNQTLTVTHRINNDELNEARTDLIQRLRDHQTNRGSIIGIKRMGELDFKPFREACLRKYSREEADVKAAELCSLWQENLQNPHWQPFKVLGTHEVIDDNDEKLKELKDAWGEKVHKAVSVALSEMNDYNPSGRYVIPQLWNFKKGRKCSLKEAMNFVFEQSKKG